MWDVVSHLELIGICHCVPYSSSIPPGKTDQARREVEHHGLKVLMIILMIDPFIYSIPRSVANELSLARSWQYDLCGNNDPLTQGEGAAVYHSLDRSGIFIARERETRGQN